MKQPTQIEQWLAKTIVMERYVVSYYATLIRLSFFLTMQTCYCLPHAYIDFYWQYWTKYPYPIHMKLGILYHMYKNFSFLQ